ncbi:MAG TPA: hypothetical protein VL084_08945 [Thermoanaerobaculia bacterium]|nr:hypothetical protein [Thermoanaerobaculia bacterium]
MRAPILLAVAALFFGRVSPAAEAPVQRAGPYEVTLHAPADGLFAGEEMELEFQVTDSRSADPSGRPGPVLFARLWCEVDMPGMPGMGRFEELAHREGVPGVYGVHPTFPHGGDYRFCITLLPPAEQPVMSPRPDTGFTVEFPLEVADAPASPHPPSSRIRPFRLEVVSTPASPEAGEPADLELRVRLENSPDLREVTDFELVHERPLHLFLVRSDLAYFAHEHPEIVSPGVFRLRYRFPAPGEYRLFADVAPRGAGSQVLQTSLRVRTGTQATPPPSPMPAGPVLAATGGGVAVQLSPPPGGLPAGKTVTVTARLTDAKGRPVEDLEPWLGALAHLLLIHQDGETFAHAHPDDREPGLGRDGRIPFLVRLPKPGLYRAWLQFQRGGRVVTEELELDAVPPAPPAFSTR